MSYQQSHDGRAFLGFTITLLICTLQPTGPAPPSPMNCHERNSSSPCCRTTQTPT